jgi:hypothetical protein
MADLGVTILIPIDGITPFDGILLPKSVPYIDGILHLE